MRRLNFLFSFIFLLGLCLVVYAQDSTIENSRQDEVVSAGTSQENEVAVSVQKEEEFISTLESLMSRV